MSIVSSLQKCAIESLSALFNQSFTEKDFQVNQTKPEFEGDYTVVMFSLVKSLKLSPDAIGNQLGEHLTKNYPQLFTKFNIIKGFLNLTVADDYWLNLLNKNYNDTCYGKKEMNGKKVMVEYSSPNTNKPLHLGHLRNNFLGWSVAEILKANGYEVIKSCIVNDRGIHICKSMIAWQLFANGTTPESTKTKGDHFVGEYYVKFNDEYKKQSKPILDFIFVNNDYNLFSLDEVNKLNILNNTITTLETKLEDEILKINVIELGKIGFRIVELYKLAKIKGGKWKDISKSLDDKNFFALEIKEKEDKQKVLQKIFKPLVSIEEKIDTALDEIKDLAGSKTSIMKATQQMLLDWENGKPDVMELWEKMNSWVYAGFDVTYKRIGSDFDIIYYESKTYLLGKNIVQQGMDKKVFYKKEDSSIWIDLTAEGLDEKIVQRKDGTSVYITQDIGLALQKYEQYKIDQSIYVIGNEQNYHMKVLQLICQKLGMPNADNIFHLSYGMVELTTGKMKSREGTVVDADDLVDEMIATSKQHTEELGKVKDFTEAELKELYDTIGLGAMKFYLLRVDPKKTMVFNPEESIDFHGFTGPFVQYTYARIKSILRKPGEDPSTTNNKQQTTNLLKLEKELIVAAEQYPAAIEQACAEHNPAVIANYVFHLAKTFNSFYTVHSIANAETEEKKQLRLQLATITANIIKSGMSLLGINVPERM
jgi:arginyl-tRNA synthetase